MNLVLIGLRGSGKTTCGKLLAERLQRRFVDCDAVVEARAGQTIAAIFAAEGEPGFRRREAAVVQELAAQDNLVLATGGGAVLNPDSVAALRRSGFVVHLEAPPEELWRRVQADIKTQTQRPQLVAGAKDGVAELAQLQRVRAAAYTAARHAVVNVGGRIPAQAAEEVLRLFAGGAKAHTA